MHVAAAARVILSRGRLPSQDDAAKDGQQRREDGRPEGRKSHGTGSDGHFGVHVAVFSILVFVIVVIVIVVVAVVVVEIPGG